MSDKLEREAIERHEQAAKDFQIFLYIAGALSMAFLLLLFWSSLK